MLHASGSFKRDADLWSEMNLDLEREIEYIEEWIEHRIEFLDDFMEDVDDFSWQ